MKMREVKFDDTEIFFDRTLHTCRLDKKSAAFPDLVIVLKENTTTGKFEVLGCAICDGSLENLVQFLLKYPQATDYTRYNGPLKEKFLDRINQRLLKGVYTADIIISK